MPKGTDKPAALQWAFPPDIPTRDFFENASLEDIGRLEEAVDNFIYWLEKDRFLTWEAVAREEQGLSLTGRQRKALGELLNFNDEDTEDDDQILYINGAPRPSEPWYVILNKIVPYLLIEPYRTFDGQWDVKCDGWQQITAALQKQGQDLSLPTGVASIEEVVPAELRHKLRLQHCFDHLCGLGQEESLTLEDPEEHDRIEWFIKQLDECKDSVAFFGLTLESLLMRLILPERDRPIFVKLLQEKLGLDSDQDLIANHLGR